MGLLGDWKASGITTEGAKISYPFYALSRAVVGNKDDQLSVEDLKNIAKLFLECKKYFDLYFNSGIKKYKTDATKFLVQVASYTMLREGKPWSWQEVRQISQGLYESMEKSPAHFLHYNTPLINNIVTEINEFIDQKSQLNISNEDLISILTKDIIPLLQKDWEEGYENFTHIQYATDVNSNEDDNSVIYKAEPSFSYIDPSKGFVYGFIFTSIGNNYFCNVYLVRYKPAENKFRALFGFDYGFTEEGEMRNPRFSNIKIVDVEGGLDKSLKYLSNQASFNNYSNPPSYVTFAQMVKNS